MCCVHRYAETPPVGTMKVVVLPKLQPAGWLLMIYWIVPLWNCGRFSEPETSRSDDAILRVITDGAGDVVLLSPPWAYLKGGGDPSDFASVACVQTPIGMKPPQSVAISGRASFWGRWKTSIKVGVPERAPPAS